MDSYIIVFFMMYYCYCCNVYQFSASVFCDYCYYYGMYIHYFWSSRCLLHFQQSGTIAGV